MTGKKDAKSLHRRIQMINLACFLLCAVICFSAGISTYSVYSNELMQRQKNALAACTGRLSLLQIFCFIKFFIILPSI